MAEFELKRVLSIKGTSAEWTANDITPADGELCVEDVGAGVMRIKIGDGITPYSGLLYVTGYTLTELEAIIDARIATFGTSVSTGPADADRLVRLNSGGLIDTTMLPPEINDLVNYFGRYLGHINARDEDVDTALGSGFTFQQGDWFINTRGTTGGDVYDPSWPGLGGQPCYDTDMAIYQAGGTAAFEIVNKPRNDDSYTPAP